MLSQYSVIKSHQFPEYHFQTEAPKYTTEYTVVFRVCNAPRDESAFCLW